MIACHKGKDKPLVTVVIPTYQRSLLLRRAILSVQKQTYSDVIVLVCDNASNDDTEAVVTHMRNADPRIVYIKHNENNHSLYYCSNSNCDTSHNDTSRIFFSRSSISDI